MNCMASVDQMSRSGTFELDLCTWEALILQWTAALLMPIVTIDHQVSHTKQMKDGVWPHPDVEFLLYKDHTATDVSNKRGPADSCSVTS